MCNFPAIYCNFKSKGATIVSEDYRFSHLSSLWEMAHNQLYFFLQEFVCIASLGPCLPSTLIIFTLHLKIKLSKIDSNKNLVLSVPHFLIFEAPNDRRWWATLGTHTFNRKNKKDIGILLQLVPCTNRKEKKSVCKRPVYKLVPGATRICGRATLKGMALLFTLIYNKEREWWQASITWYTRYATAQSQQRLAFHIPFFFFTQSGTNMIILFPLA